MKTLLDRAKRVRHTFEVHIPTLDGESVAYKVPIKVWGLKDPSDGELYLDGEALELIDRTKARHMGLMAPEEIKALRIRHGMTQKEISGLLQIGAKTYTRWEAGRDRPSRSLNLVLCSLRDGKIDVSYLKSLQPDLTIRPKRSLGKKGDSVAHPRSGRWRRPRLN